MRPRFLAADWLPAFMARAILSASDCFIPFSYIVAGGLTKEGAGSKEGFKGPDFVHIVD